MTMTPDEQKRIFCKNLKNLVDNNPKSQKEIAKDLGISYTTFNTWMRGAAMPQSTATIQNIADYFGVGKSALLDEDPPAYYLDPETAKVAQEMHDNKELRVLFDAARDAKPEDLQTVYDMLMALKRKEQGDSDSWA